MYKPSYRISKYTFSEMKRDFPEITMVPRWRFFMNGDLVKEFPGVKVENIHEAVEKYWIKYQESKGIEIIIRQ